MTQALAPEKQKCALKALFFLICWIGGSRKLFFFTVAVVLCFWASPLTLRNIPSARDQTLFPARCADRHAGTWLSSASSLCATRSILPAVEWRTCRLRCR